MQLRYLQTLDAVGQEEGSTVLLRSPLDVIGSIVGPARQNGRGTGTGVADVVVRSAVENARHTPAVGCERLALGVHMESRALVSSP